MMGNVQVKSAGRHLLRLVLLLAVVGGAFFLARIASENDVVRNVVARFGYPGVFFFVLLTGFNFLFPIPAVSFMPLFLEAGLNFWFLVPIFAVALTVADSIAYFIGKTGRELVSKREIPRIISYLERLGERYWWGPVVGLFIFASFIPFPNELVMVPLGFLGYRLRLVLPPLFAGHLVFNMIYSLGIIQLFGAL